MSEYFDTSPPDPIERLARMHGQTNFFMAFDGNEESRDTSDDMAASSFARKQGCIPEALEAYAGASDLFKLPLMAYVFRIVQAQLRPPEKDYPWIQGAIADAFLLLQRGMCKPAEVRAKKLKVRKEDYLAMRKAAYGELALLVADARPKWIRARLGNQ